MAYTKTNWENNPSTATPVSSSNLNNLENGVAAAHAQLDGRLSEGQLNATIAEGITGSPVLPASYAQQIGGSALPAWAGARSGQWIRELALYNAKSPALRAFRTLVRGALRGDASKRIVCAGDSKTFGSDSGSVPATSYPTQLMGLLGASEDRVTARTDDGHFTANTGFVQEAPTNNNWIRAANGGTITYTTTEPCTGIELYGYISAGGTVSVVIDGGAPQSWNIAAGSNWKKYPVGSLADTNHTVVITAAAGVNFVLESVRPTYTDARLLIAQAGCPSSNAADWEAINWSTLFSSAFGDAAGPNVPDPDAIIFDIGTNTGTSTVADIGDALTAIAGLGVPVLIAAFGGIADTSGYNAKRSKLYDMADSLNLPLIDFSVILGAYDAANARGFMFNSVHETARGQAAKAAAVALVLRP